MPEWKGPQGSTRINVDEPLDGQLFWVDLGAPFYESSWFYMTNETQGHQIYGGFPLEFVLSICVSMDEEHRAIQERIAAQTTTWLNDQIGKGPW
jgi:hypothetical protein